MPFEKGRNIDDRHAADCSGGNDFETADRLRDVRRHIRLHRPDDDVFTALAAAAGLVEQAKRLADPGRVTEKDLQLAASLGTLLRFDLSKKRFGIALALHPENVTCARSGRPARD